MEPQVPAMGITQIGDFPTGKFYKVRCDCGNSDDDIDLSIETEYTGITVNFFTKVKTNYWDNTWQKRYDIDNQFLQDLHWFGFDLINGIWNRLKMTWKLWTKGYLEYESYAVLDTQTALNLSEVLKTAIPKVEEERNKLYETDYK